MQIISYLNKYNVQIKEGSISSIFETYVKDIRHSKLNLIDINTKNANEIEVKGTLVSPRVA